jgi:hypothetical protein
MQEDAIFGILTIVFMAFGPVVTCSISKYVTISIECSARNGYTNGVEHLETLFTILVPE